MTSANDNRTEDEEVVEQHFIACALALLRHRGATDSEVMLLSDILWECCAVVEEEVSGSASA